MSDLNQRLLTVDHHRQKQTQYKRVLCVCSAGMIRSATAAWVLSNPPYNFNTRACGTKHYALVPVDEVLLKWADVILFAEYEHYRDVENKFPNALLDKPNFELCLPDDFEYRDPLLMKLLDEMFLDMFR